MLKWKNIILAILAVGAPAFGCGSTSGGTTVECGSNWIRYRQRSDSFERYNNFGRRGYVRRPDIRGGCLVFGPYAEAPFAGSLNGYAVVEALVDVATIPMRAIHVPIPGSSGHTVLVPTIGNDTEMFTMDMTADSGQTILGRKVVKFGEMSDWTGHSTPYSRCTAADPCTAGGPGHGVRHFKLYRNAVNHDVFGRSIRNPMSGIEVRVCGLNPALTSLDVEETVIELSY